MLFSLENGRVKRRYKSIERKDFLFEEYGNMEGLKNTEEMDLCFFLSYKPSKGVCLQVLEGHGDELHGQRALVVGGV